MRITNHSCWNKRRDLGQLDQAFTTWVTEESKAPTLHVGKYGRANPPWGIPTRTPDASLASVPNM